MYLVQKGHAELFETAAGEHRGQAGTAALCCITTALLWTLDIHWLGRRIAVVATTAWRHATVRLLRWRWVVSTLRWVSALRRVPATRRTAHGVAATLTRWGTCRWLVSSPSGTARSSIVIIFRRHGGRPWGNERGAERRSGRGSPACEPCIHVTPWWLGAQRHRLEPPTCHGLPSSAECGV